MFSIKNAICLHEQVKDILVNRTTVRLKICLCDCFLMKQLFMTDIHRFKHKKNTHGQRSVQKTAPLFKLYRLQSSCTYRGTKKENMTSSLWQFHSNATVHQGYLIRYVFSLRTDIMFFEFWESAISSRRLLTY